MNEVEDSPRDKGQREQTPTETVGLPTRSHIQLHTLTCMFMRVSVAVLE